jgi:hypothetical protein
MRSGPTPKAAVLSAAAALMLPSPAGAQDANYWSIAYGPVAQLVGGQVIGSSRDLSATYYNPGALGMQERIPFLLSTESFQLETVSSEPTGSFELFDVSSSRFGTAPSLVAGVLPRWFGEDTRLAWSFLTRQELKMRLGERLLDPIADPTLSSVAESYVDQNMTENWGGLTVSHRFSDTWGLGMTLYGVYRSQRSRSELSILGAADNGGGLSVVGLTDFDYHHARLLTKLGLAYDNGDRQLGLSVTTPSLGVFGGGKVGYTRSLSGVDANRDGATDPARLEARNEEDLAATYRSSWAVGAGGAWKRGATRFHVSAEWFAPVSRFTVLSLPTTSTSVPVALTQQLAGVINAGVGVEHEMENRMAVYGAFRTDFSASVGDSSVNIAVSDWDLYHLSTGLSFHLGDSQFTLGTTFSLGGRTRPPVLPIPPEGLPAAHLDDDVQIRYRRFVFLLGFLFGGD